MERKDHNSGSNANTILIWIGRAISLIIVAMLIMSAVMKLKGRPEVLNEFKRLGIPDALTRPLAIGEIVCAILYLIPLTSVTGAILLTGYFGGAICAHLRVNDPFHVPVLVAVVLWLGIFLREPRIRTLVPFRITHD